MPSVTRTESAQEDDQPGSELIEDQRETPSDGELLTRAAEGDLEAFNQFVKRHQRAVVGLCAGILRDARLAEDVTQDAFIRAWKNLPSFKGDAAKAWLLRIATNRCLDLLRQRNRQATDSLDAQIVELEPRWTTQTPSESPESEAERVELGDRLDAALAELPDDQRVALVMADVLGYEYLDIAELTGSAMGTVKSRISRARARLRSALLADSASREHFERYVRP